MSRRLPDYHPRQLSRTFERKLGIDFREGKHRVGWYFLDGRKAFRVTMPNVHENWGPPVQRSLLKATMLPPDEFNNLVSCSMTGPQYEARLRQILARETQ